MAAPSKEQDGNSSDDKSYDVWECLACGWLISDEMYKAAICNYPCGRCGALPLSYFRRRTMQHADHATTKPSV